jgi:hypothetical protein
MIEILWTCDICGADTKTRGIFDEWHIDEAPPEGWGAFLEPSRLLCPTCQAEERKHGEKNPDAVGVA